MFDLRINNLSIDLTPRTRVRYTLDNPIFDADGLPRGYSFPFRIPATPRNLGIFGYANRLDIRAKQRKYTGILYIAGVPIETGVVQITGGSGDSIEIVLKNTARDLIDELANIRLHDLLGTVSVPDTANAGVIRYYLENTTSWTIKIDDNTFFYDAPGATQADGQLALISQINAVYIGLAAPFSTDHIELLTNQYPDANYRVSEWLNVTYVSGITVYEGNVVNLQNFVNSLATTPREDITFPTIYAFYFHERQTVISVNQYLNYWLDGTDIDNVATTEKDWNHSYVPFIRFRHLLELIINQLGYEAAGPLYESDWIQQLVYYTNKSLDDLLEGDFGPTLNYFNQHLQSIVLKDYIPDWTGTDLFDLLKFLNYYFEIDNNELQIRSRVAPLRQPPIDWTGRTEKGYGFDIPEYEGYRLEYAKIEGELDLFDNQITAYGTGENTIPFPVRPLYSSRFSNLDGYTWQVPATNKPGNSQTIGLENDTDIRIAFDRGLQEDTDGNNYVQGSTTDLDSNGDATFTSSLLLEGDNGVFKSHWEGWIEPTDATTVRRRCVLSIADILELKKWRNPMRYIYDPQGTMVGVIKRVSLDIDTNGLGTADIEFILKQ
ncbi:hypothetical protein [Flavilitoribacter nigricans]|uniref:Uncharacterized protein n=1 Tax=Flavilitoribacter nigricans (strain ATCC 23147 / DSM 23189 / NBRC 102662 / NCIMB 1420 / SS-2) TaxID=1122177 RepID=A0A2D0NEP2_FLAN2|nr:hypothetical protein [Flavilitoribacter nigricans]PHN06945.1 hypothetical protein CRP01_09015 [Flavilitoribacter nigricans DSM 23189 = NBRC 102662]